MSIIKVPFCTMRYLIFNIKVPVLYCRLFLFISQFRELQHLDFNLIILYTSFSSNRPILLTFKTTSQKSQSSNFNNSFIFAKFTNRRTMFNFSKCSCFKKIPKKRKNSKKKIFVLPRISKWSRTAEDSFKINREHSKFNMGAGWAGTWELTERITLEHRVFFDRT